MNSSNEPKCISCGAPSDLRYVDGIPLCMLCDKIGEKLNPDDLPLERTYGKRHENGKGQTTTVRYQ
ncbi:hypothetical protein ACWNT8_15435 (plasmid) [Pigmentibacter ruber]